MCGQGLRGRGFRRLFPVGAPFWARRNEAAETSCPPHSRPEGRSYGENLAQALPWKYSSARELGRKFSVRTPKTTIRKAKAVPPRPSRASHTEGL